MWHICFRFCPIATPSQTLAFANCCYFLPGAYRRAVSCFAVYYGYYIECKPVFMPRSTRLCIGNNFTGCASPLCIPCGLCFAVAVCFHYPERNARRCCCLVKCQKPCPRCRVHCIN